MKPASLSLRGARTLVIAAAFAGLSGCLDSAPPYVDASAAWRDFDGGKAFAHVSDIAAMGPRPPGSDSLEKSRVHIEEHLRAHGWQVRRQTFTAKTPNGPVEFANLRARFAEKDSDALWRDTVRVLIASHYDTKLYRDLEFVGANDPGSSIGALMEFSRVLSLRPKLARHIELIFFDGEEAFGPNITPTDGLYGSRQYGREILRPLRPKQKPRWGVLLDMVGDRDLKITLPNDTPPELMRLTLESAEELGHRAHFSVSRTSIIDDHVPLNVEGVPTVDIIDFDYPYWHTPSDTLDKLSPESLAIVGQTALHLIEKRLMRE
jgi:glutaminyl-peptide cyclotransferase